MAMLLLPQIVAVNPVRSADEQPTVHDRLDDRQGRVRGRGRMRRFPGRAQRTELGEIGRQHDELLHPMPTFRLEKQTVLRGKHHLGPRAAHRRLGQQLPSRSARHSVSFSPEMNTRPPETVRPQLSSASAGPGTDQSFSSFSAVTR